ncbi:hypothetical protein TNCV_2310221 [Trichonephila clavipes]|nr:hypothetical protein TNCV_2310221 [Trichonephila clavipes]
MHLIYGLAKENARAAERLFRERYPQRDALNHRMFSIVCITICVNIDYYEAIDVLRVGYGIQHSSMHVTKDVRYRSKEPEYYVGSSSHSMSPSLCLLPRKDPYHASCITNWQTFGGPVHLSVGTFRDTIFLLLVNFLLLLLQWIDSPGPLQNSFPGIPYFWQLFFFQFLPFKIFRSFSTQTIHFNGICPEVYFPWALPKRFSSCNDLHSFQPDDQPI